MIRAMISTMSSKRMHNSSALQSQPIILGSPMSKTSKVFCSEQPREQQIAPSNCNQAEKVKNTLPIFTKRPQCHSHEVHKIKNHSSPTPKKCSQQEMLREHVEMLLIFNSKTVRLLELNVVQAPCGLPTACPHQKLFHMFQPTPRPMPSLSISNLSLTIFRRP